MLMAKSYHSVHDLSYHLILVTKYRAEVISGASCDRMHQMFSDIGEKYGIEPKEFNHDTDHIHILFTAKPTTNLVGFINSYKSATSRIIKKEFPEVKEHLWKEMFWSRSYYLATAGEVTSDILNKYIHSQGRDDKR